MTRKGLGRRVGPGPARQLREVWAGTRGGLRGDDGDRHARSLRNAGLRAEVEQLLFLEARFLDGRRWDDWLALWAEGATYSMPTRSTPQWSADSWERPVEAELSRPGRMFWIDETKLELEMRVAKLKTGMAWAEDPPSRTRRLITNVEVSPAAASDGLDVRSNFLLYRSRLDCETELIAGSREDVVERFAGELRLRSRRVVLDANVLKVTNLVLFF